MEENKRLIITIEKKCKACAQLMTTMKANKQEVNTLVVNLLASTVKEFGIMGYGQLGLDDEDSRELMSGQENLYFEMPPYVVSRIILERANGLFMDLLSVAVSCLETLERLLSSCFDAIREEDGENHKALSEMMKALWTDSNIRIVLSAIKKCKQENFPTNLTILQYIALPVPSYHKAKLNVVLRYFPMEKLSNENDCVCAECVGSQEMLSQYNTPEMGSKARALVIQRGGLDLLLANVEQELVGGDNVGLATDILHLQYLVLVDKEAYNLLCKKENLNRLLEATNPNNTVSVQHLAMLLGLLGTDVWKEIAEKCSTKLATMMEAMQRLFTASKQKKKKGNKMNKEESLCALCVLLRILATDANTKKVALTSLFSNPRTVEKMAISLRDNQYVQEHCLFALQCINWNKKMVESIKEVNIIEILNAIAEKEVQGNDNSACTFKVKNLTQLIRALTLNQEQLQRWKDTEQKLLKGLLATPKSNNSTPLPQVKETEEEDTMKELINMVDSLKNVNSKVKKELDALLAVMSKVPISLKEAKQLAKEDPFWLHGIAIKYEAGVGVDQNYHEAIRYYTEAFEKAQNSFSALQLGAIYKNVVVDFKKSFEWYHRSGSLGNPIAQHKVAYYLDEGIGTPANSTEALKWYKKAAEQGYKYSCHNLGIIYEGGGIVPKNLQQSRYWYERGAECEFAPSLLALGNICIKESNVPKAIQYYSLASQQDNPTAQHLLGMVYSAPGEHQDFNKAIYWLQRAAKNGNVDSPRYLSELEAKLKKQPFNPVGEVEKVKGNEQFKAGNYTEAAVWYTKGHQLDPTNMIHLSNRAAAYLKLKMYEKCIVDCENAVMIGCEHPERAQNTKAMMLKAMARMTTAMSLLTVGPNGCAAIDNKALPVVLEKTLEYLVRGTDQISLEMMKLCFGLSLCGSVGVRKALRQHLMEAVVVCILACGNGEFNDRGIFALGTLANLTRLKKTVSVLIDGTLLPLLVSFTSHYSVIAGASLQALSNVCILCKPAKWNVLRECKVLNCFLDNLNHTDQDVQLIAVSGLGRILHVIPLEDVKVQELLQLLRNVIGGNSSEEIKEHAVLSVVVLLQRSGLASSTVRAATPTEEEIAQITKKMVSSGIFSSEEAANLTSSPSFKKSLDNLFQFSGKPKGLLASFNIALGNQTTIGSSPESARTNTPRNNTPPKEKSKLAEQRCTFCRSTTVKGNSGKLLACARCGTPYCCRECQVSDWQRPGGHKLTCKPLHGSSA